MNIPWFLSRSVGLTAYLILFLTVVLGISIRTKGLDRFVARWKVTDIHTFLSLLTIGLVLVHAGALLWDSFIGYSVLNIVVPFSTGYRTLWTAVGIGMAYLLIITALSSPARRWIGYRAWRTLHYGTFVIYLGALAHGIFTGTDSKQWWAQGIYVVTAGAVVALVVYRVELWRRREHSALAPVIQAGSSRRAPADAIYAAREAGQRQEAVRNRATVFGLVAIGAAGIVFVAAATGPFGWQGEAAASDDTTAPVVVSNGDGSGFSDTFSGSATQVQSASGLKVSLKATATGQRPVALDAELLLVRGSNGRTVASSNAITLADPAGANICTGEVQRLDEDSLVANCDGSGPFAGSSLTLNVSFDQGLTTKMTGTLVATVAR